MEIILNLGFKSFNQYSIGNTKDGIPVPIKGSFVTIFEITFEITSNATINIDTDKIYVSGSFYNCTPLADALIMFRDYLQDGSPEETLYKRIQNPAVNGIQPLYCLFEEFRKNICIIRRWEDDNCYKLLKKFGNSNL